MVVRSVWKAATGSQRFGGEGERPLRTFCGSLGEVHGGNAEKASEGCTAAWLEVFCLLFVLLFVYFLFCFFY